MQTLVASSDGKGKEEKQAPALSKLGLIKATGVQRQKEIPIVFLKDLCPLLVLVLLWVLICMKQIVANWVIES